MSVVYAAVHEILGPCSTRQVPVRGRICLSGEREQRDRQRHTIKFSCIPARRYLVDRSYLRPRSGPTWLQDSPRIVDDPSNQHAR